MDIYYFYNGINNILKLALKDKKYLDNYKLILNDPLVIIDFESSSKLKGGASQAIAMIAKNPKVLEMAKDAMAGEKGTKSEPNTKESDSNNKEYDELSPKEQALQILKVLFSIVYYLCLFSILPLLPFIAISYYSFKRLKIFYNEKMGTL